MKTTSLPVTITLHPAVDTHLTCPNFSIGATQRYSQGCDVLGGKGINVAKTLGHLGIPCIATGLIGEEDMERFTSELTQMGVESHWVSHPGKTRVCYKINDPTTGVTTELNGQSPPITTESLAGLTSIVQKLATPGRWFIVSGSLAPGMSVADFQQLLQTLKSHQARIAVDTSGPALWAAIENQVDLIKPNHHEIADLFKVPPSPHSSWLPSVQQWQQSHVPEWIVSCGDGGAYFFTENTCHYTPPCPDSPQHTVGAGDSMLAGYLYGKLTHQSARECAQIATACAWTTLQNPSPQEIRHAIIRASAIPYKSHGF